MGISSAGIGSGLEVSSIVSQLVALERKPIDKLKTAESSIQTKISSFGKVQSLMSTLRDAAAGLGGTTLWKQSTVSSADATAVSATTSGSVAAGDYAVSVSKLAQAHTLYSNVVASDPGIGSMTISSGSTSATLNFTDPGTTLDQVRDAINGSGTGITAAVVKDVNGNARLSLSAKATGTSNQIAITTSGAAYSDFAFDPSNPSAPGMTQAQAAQDAELTINGVPVTSSTNEVTTAISGLTLTLTKQTASPVKLTVNTDTTAQKKAMEDFVSAYNALNSYLNEQTKYDDSTKTGAPLQGDSTARTLRSQMRSLLGQNAGVSTVFTNLNSVGLELQKDGSLKLNATKVDAALKQPGELSNFFTPVAPDYPVFNGFGVAFRKLADSVTGTEGMLSTRTSGLQTQLKRNRTDQSTLEDRVARTQARLEKYYQALDTKMSSINALSSYVNQQISAWNKSSSDK